MAEPQPRTASEDARAKSAGAGGANQQRSFDPARDDARRDDRLAALDAAGQASQAAAESGRQIAEHSRRAGRQVADAWRQAVDPLLTMQYDMSQWFDEVFRRTFGFGAAPNGQAIRPMSHLTAASFFGLPPADMRETESAHLLAIELPGLAREDVDLSLGDDRLIVCGHKTEENDDASASYRVSERRFGRFERVFPLPPDVDRGKIEAQFRDGVLKITLPKNPAAAQPRSRIEIH